MTGYFSVPLNNIEYGIQDYWVSFTVLLAVSWVALFVFGIFNGTVQTSTFWRKLWGGMVKVGGRSREWARGI